MDNDNGIVTTSQRILISTIFAVGCFSFFNICDVEDDMKIEHWWLMNFCGRNANVLG